TCFDHRRRQVNCRLVAQQQKGRQLGSELSALLGNDDYSRLTTVVAFLRSEGVAQLKDSMSGFKDSGKNIQFIVGISRRVTSYEGLKLLLEVSGHGSVVVFHNSNSAAGIFHPKLYFFEGKERSAVVIASNNFTESGLFLNYELAVVIELEHQSTEDAEFLNELHEY